MNKHTPVKKSAPHQPEPSPRKDFATRSSESEPLDDQPSSATPAPEASTTPATSSSTPEPLDVPETATAPAASTDDELALDVSSDDAASESELVLENEPELPFDPVDVVDDRDPYSAQAICQRHGWRDTADVVATLERRAATSHGSVADCDLMRDTAGYLRDLAGMDRATNDA